MKHLVPYKAVAEKIYFIRGHKVMLSFDLAELYGVETRALIQAVKRNAGRFPRDFAFQISWEEAKNLKSRFVISSWGGVRRAPPYAFTEQGVAMLSSVLRSKTAIGVNIAIMRAFVRLRKVVSAHKALAQKLRELERKVQGHDEEILEIFKAIKNLMIVPQMPKRKMGFHP